MLTIDYNQEKYATPIGSVFLKNRIFMVYLFIKNAKSNDNIKVLKVVLNTKHTKVADSFNKYIFNNKFCFKSQHFQFKIHSCDVDIDILGKIGT